MTTESTDLISQLRATLGKMEIALGAIDEAIVWTDEKGTIQWCNNSFDLLVGLTHLEVLGARLFELLPIEHQGQGLLPEQHPLVRALKGPDKAHGTYEFSKGASRSFLEITAAGIQLNEQDKTVVLAIHDITERKQTEEKLARSHESLELRVAERTEELSKQKELLDEGQSLAKFGTIQRDLQTGEGWWSDEVYTILGMSPQKPAPTLEAFLEHVHPDDVEELKETMATSRKTGYRDGEYRIIRSNGEELTVHARAKVHYDEEGNPVRLIGTILDITERKKAQEALRKSEERLLVAQEVAHFGSFERNLQTGAGWWSDEVYRILGVSCQECEPSFDNYLSHVHPEDLERVKALSLKGSEEAGINRSDCRIIRPSGEIRTVYNQVRTFTDESGTPIRRVGTILDITERKQAELEIQQAHTQLLALSRRLIQTQEQERRRIALELHDQLGQELALLSIEIEQLIQKAPESQAKQLRKLTTKTRAISTYVQTLSHQLHPSQLQHLGLVAAARSLCKEVSKASGIQIDFSHTSVPSPIPQDVSICLFRVLQESLTNIVKHSEAQAAQVEFAGGSDKLHLRVCDSGVGFSPESVGNDGGLGFVSMRERLSLVGGELLIESQPSVGTQIEVCVPLNSSASPD